MVANRGWRSSSISRLAALFNALIGALFAASAIASCQGDAGAPLPPLADAGLDAVAWDAGFAGSPCRGCLEATCVNETAACKGNQECSTFYACLLGCPTSDGGPADPNCKATCPQPVGSVGVDVYERLVKCSETAKTNCEACSDGTPASCKHPLTCQQCSPTVLQNPCAKCWIESCCDTFYACDGAAECLAVSDCVGECSNTQCFSQCFQLHPSHAQVWLDDNACFSFFCDDACDNPFRPTPECAACQKGPCVKEHLDCETDAGCFVLKLCLSGCTDDKCIAACINAAPAHAADLLENFQLCTQHHCGGAC